MFQDFLKKLCICTVLIVSLASWTAGLSLEELSVEIQQLKQNNAELNLEIRHLKENDVSKIFKRKMILSCLLNRDINFKN